MQANSSKKMEENKIPGFGRRLKSLFVQETYTEIGKLLGVEKSAVANYVNDYPPKLKILLKISELKNVSIDWLLTGEEEKKPSVAADESAKNEEEFEGLFFDYKSLTAEDKEELRGLMAYVDHEIKKVKRKREQRNLTTDKAGLE